MTSTRRRLAPSLMLAVVVLALTVAASVSLGSEKLSPLAAWRAPGLERTVMLQLRLPRVLLAVVAGGGLALVGAAFQALLRNPLAEPYVLGVSGGAALGATTAIALGLGSGVAWLAATILPLAAFAGGLAATAVVYAVARRAPRGPAGASILLAGVMVNAIAASLITISKLLVPPWRAQQMLRWLVGFVDLVHPIELAMVAGYVLLGCTLLLRDAGRMNLLSLGDEAAHSLGVDVRVLERRIFLLASLVVGAIVSVTGLIGFVGLVVPHAVRRVVGPDHRVLLPLSFVAGGALLTCCDLGARMAFVVFETQLPVGAITAAFGGPAFLLILVRGGRR